MRKKLFSIWSVLLVLVFSIAVLVPSCTPTTGTIEVKATLDGIAWPSSGTGAVDYTLTGPGATAPTVIDGTKVPDSFSGDPGSWTCAYVSGGPGTFVDITTAPTQSVTAGNTTTFTLNFVTPVPPTQVDASVEFVSWTINGVRVDPGPVYAVYPGDWVDIEYKEHVSGEEDAVVTVHQTSWLKVHNTGFEGTGEGPSIWLHVVNAPGAVTMDPSADKLYQDATVEGVIHPPCDEIELKACVPVNLDVEVGWELVVCNNYTKTINWIGFPPAGSMILVDGPEVLFDATVIDNWVSLNLTSWACVEVGEGFEDYDPSNDCTDPCPTLTIIHNPVAGP